MGVQWPFVVCFLLLWTGCSTGASAPAEPETSSDAPQACNPLGTAYTRTTMYFGLNRPMGNISESEWQAFLRDEVTPRFPEGLTVLEADGQYRRQDGTIERERSKVLVIVHDNKPSTQEALNEVVLRYKQSFSQHSVLWETARVCAAF